MKHRKTYQIATCLLKMGIYLLFVLTAGCSGSEQQITSEPLVTSHQPVKTEILGAAPTYNTSQIGIPDYDPAYANAPAINGR